MNEHAADNRTTRGNRLWLLGALVLSVIAAGLIFRDQDDGPGSGLLPPQLSDEPDVYIEQGVLRQFDEHGELQYWLASAELRYFERDGITQLSAPDLTLYDRERHPWQIRAARGTIHNRDPGGTGEDVVQLRDDVVVEQGEHAAPLRMTTSALTLYPDRQYAETDQAVIIDGEVGRTAAGGLEGDLQGGLLKLYSSADRPVQTILLPHQFK